MIPGWKCGYFRALKEHTGIDNPLCLFITTVRTYVCRIKVRYIHCDCMCKANTHTHTLTLRQCTARMLGMGLVPCSRAPKLMNGVCSCSVCARVRLGDSRGSGGTPRRAEGLSGCVVAPGVLVLSLSERIYIKHKGGERV